MIAAAMLAVSLMGLGACSSFNRQFSEARKLHPGGPDGHPLLGAWEGTWTSDRSGHDGSMRAIVTEGDDDAYEVWYKGIYGGWIPFDYRVRMTAVQEAGAMVFSGEEDLGERWGGLYQYSGHADGSVYEAAYTSAKDHGRFELTRPK